MVANFKQVLQILASLPTHKSPWTHDRVLELVAGDDTDTAAVALLHIFTDDEHKYDEYWERVFEAFIVAHIDQGAKIVLAMVDWLKHERFTASNMAHPLVMLALIRATTHHGQASNEALEMLVPNAFGKMLLSFSEGSSSRGSKEVGMWTLGQMSSAFRAYFDSNNLMFWYRISTFCELLKEVNHIGRHAQAFVDEIIMHLLKLMPRVMRTKIVASSWLEAKKLNDANERRQVDLAEHDSTFDKLHRRVT